MKPTAPDDESASEVKDSDVRPMKRPHVSLYISKTAQKSVKQLALDRNMRAHDIYIEALRKLLADHGIDLDYLNAN